MGKVALNTSMLTDKPSGVGIYTIKLMESLYKLSGKVEFNRYGLNKSNSGLLAIYRLLWNVFILPWTSRGDELVFSFSSHGSPFLRRQIITVHDLISLNFPDQHRVQYLYFKYIIPLILKSCVKVVAISEFTKSEIIRFYQIPAEKIVVIRNGANFVRKIDNPNDQEKVLELTKGLPYCICVGAAYSHKNIHRLLDAIALLNNDCLFVIVGKENAYFDTIREKAKSLQLDNVCLLDYVEESFLQALYKGAVCNIYVSLYEGFGFPPMEAAACGTVSLVSAIPALKEIYGEAVMYTDPLNTQDMAEKISLIVKKEVDVESYVRHFSALLSAYSWEKAAIETMELINDNLSGGTDAK